MWAYPRKNQTRFRLLAGLFGFAISMLPGATVQAGTEKPAPAEHNPPGDIPDNQVFVTYSSPDGYELQIPEGWARRTTLHHVQFADKYDAISVDLQDAPAAPTVESIKAGAAAQLKQQGHAVDLKAVTAATLKGGPVVRVVYRSNSEPSPVTNTQRRLENERYYYFRDGKLAIVDLAAPLGADNVDQWQLISNSFRWK